ncbi:MAG: endonuclease domain-containing protein [Nostoc sp. SerVER01]|nr:endonuclease domain-containing protein [Nostoc sp. SerVER01]MDZ8026310.1 endonuclease domain-containing protein [Nostoc sp. DedQUE11]MDZ8076094.1 endonuclease domain-containing protein [Nostoc sp. DedQUE01]MDZ8079096.1 endonuclease domain-containing protein [Nostoc sp. DcaGUA01]
MSQNENPNPNPTPDSSPPSSLAGRGLGGGVPGNVWQTPYELWKKLKPLARQMRREPTPAEKLLWQKLRHKQLLGFKFRRQQAIDRFIVDFYCHEAQFVVEVDGEVHDYSKEEDGIRQEFLESLGLRVMRFRNEDVVERMEGVLEDIAGWLQR